MVSEWREGTLALQVPDSWVSKIEVGAHCRNLEYEYTVAAIEGDYVIAQLPDGTTKRLSRPHAEALDLGMRLADAALGHADPEMRLQAAERLASTQHCSPILDIVHEQTDDDAVRHATRSEEERRKEREQEAASAGRETAREAMLAMHRRRLESLGLEYRGVRPARAGYRRVTHCWSCKRHLDSSVDVECAVCGWILCRCGACGCGYDES